MIENKEIFTKDFGEEFLVQGTGVTFVGIFSIEKVLWENGDGASVETYVPSIIVFDTVEATSVTTIDVIVRSSTGVGYTIPNPVFWSSTGQGKITLEEL